MIRRAALFACVPVLLSVGLARAQESYPIMEKVAQKVIQKYQTSSCQQLAQQKSQPPPGKKRSWSSARCKSCATIPRCGPSFSTVWRRLSPTNCSSAA